MPPSANQVQTPERDAEMLDLTAYRTRGLAGGWR